MFTSCVMPALSAFHRSWLIWWYILHATSCKCEFHGLSAVTQGYIIQLHTAIWWMQAWKTCFLFLWNEMVPPGVHRGVLLHFT